MKNKQIIDEDKTRKIEALESEIERLKFEKFDVQFRATLRQFYMSQELSFQKQREVLVAIALANFVSAGYIALLLWALSHTTASGLITSAVVIVGTFHLVKCVVCSIESAYYRCEERAAAEHVKRYE